MFENDANADETVSRRSVLETTGGFVAESTALAGLGSERGAATPDGHCPLRAELGERNEKYIAVEVWFPHDTFDEIKPLNDVYLGDADQFAVHAEEDAVSLPEEPERLAAPVEMKHLGDDGQMHGKLMYFRTGDVDWPKEYDGVAVTLGVGAFSERTVLGDHWDTCPGLWIDVREMTEDEIVVKARLPDDLEADDVFSGSPPTVFLGHADQFVIHEEGDAVSLPGNHEEVLASPVEIERLDEETCRMYFRTRDIDFSEVEDEEVTLSLGLFTERTMPTTYFDVNGRPEA